jgi:hypothetical protein
MTAPRTNGERTDPSVRTRRSRPLLERLVAGGKSLSPLELLDPQATTRTPATPSDGSPMRTRAEKEARDDLSAAFAARSDELDELSRRFRRTSTYLLLVCVLAISGSLALLASVDEIDGAHAAALAIIGGTLGSAVAALLSAAQRVANGFELSNGAPWPREAKGEKFNARMAPFFVIRPFLGAGAGLIMYSGAASGLLISTSKLTTTSLLFIALLAGLFAKTLFEVLLGVFKALVGR